MPDYLGDDMRKTKDDKEEEKEIKGSHLFFRLFTTVLLFKSVNQDVLKIKKNILTLTRSKHLSA